MILLNIEKQYSWDKIYWHLHKLIMQNLIELVIR